MNNDQPTTDRPVVEIRSLTKRFGDFVAVDNLDLSLERGNILGFIGPNGAGKTTTIKILVGLSKPTSGSAVIDGVDCTRNANRIKHLVGYMPDSFGSYDNMRVREYLDFFAAAFKIPRKTRLMRIDELMDLTGSSYMKDQYVVSLSHGMKQRVGIARTLLHDPKVLILDEPANGLDPQARIEIREILLNLAQIGKTLIVTSHILPELSRICDRIAIITHGKLRAFGTLDEVMRAVTQRRNFEVELLCQHHIEVTADVIRQLLEKNAEVTASNTESIIRFSTERDDQAMAKLLTTLTSKSLKIVQFREVPLNLEDAFLSVTRKTQNAT